MQLPGIDEEERKRAEKDMSTQAFLEFRLVHENSSNLTRALLAKGESPEGYRIVTIEGQPVYKRDENVTINSSSPVYRQKLHRFGKVPGYDFLLEKMDQKQQTVYEPFFVKRRYEMTGEHLDWASAGIDPMAGSTVNIRFDGEGTKKFADVTSAYAPGGVRNPGTDKYFYLAIVLDDVLHSAPRIKDAI